jgi:hypothetical protein
MERILIVMQRKYQDCANEAIVRVAGEGGMEGVRVLLLLPPDDEPRTVPVPFALSVRVKVFFPFMTQG